MQPFYWLEDGGLRTEDRKHLSVEGEESEDRRRTQLGSTAVDSRLYQSNERRPADTAANWIFMATHQM